MRCICMFVEYEMNSGTEYGELKYYSINDNHYSYGETQAIRCRIVA